MSLRVADNLTLPDDTVTEPIGILAARGAGKTNTAVVMAEEMHKAGLQFVAVDPVGAWWGLRSAQNGQGPGLPIPIFGGKHGDIPLERGAGQLVADLIVDQRLSCVLDVSNLDSEASKKAFLLEFGRRLYQRNEEPLHLFLEEADDYIPQRPMRDEAQLLRAWENIVRRGRARGLGCTLITQRSAALNKQVLTQVQTLIAMRTTGPQDRAAIEDWLRYHAQSREILESLPALENGEAWVWSPQFLKRTIKVRFRRRETYDSGATPKVSRQSRAPATLADIDLSDLETRMAATIEKAKAEDPRELRRRIAELEREVAKVRPAERLVVRDLPVLTDDDRQLLAGYARTVHDRSAKATLTIHEAWSRVEGALAALTTHDDQVLAMVRRLDGSIQGIAKAPNKPVIQKQVSTARRPESTDGDVPALRRAERRILAALAQYAVVGRTMRQVATLTGYAINGGGFRNAVGSLRSGGLIEGRDRLSITEMGLATIGENWEPLPQGEALAEHWMAQLPRAERLILQTLIDNWPQSLSVAEVAGRTGYAVDGGGFRNALGKLRTLELIEGRADLKASDDFFQEQA